MVITILQVTVAWNIYFISENFDLSRLDDIIPETTAAVWG